MSPNPPTPLGTLIRLPPELRDKIYDHVLDQSYLVFWTYHHADGDIPTVSADLEIRRVSKTLSAEASARLFSNATVFTFLIRFDHDDRLSPPPMKEATEGMMNVQFLVDTAAGIEGDYVSMVEGDMVFYERCMWGDDIIPMVTANGEVRGRQTLYYPATMDPRCEASVEHFAGSGIERNNFFVTFRDFDASFHLFMATRFFQTMKKCIGFRNVTVVLEWWWQLDEWGKNVVAVAEKVDDVRMELEQCWGPCVVRDELDQFKKTIEGEDAKMYLVERGTLREDMKLFFTFELAFQPLKFRGANLKGER